MVQHLQEFRSNNFTVSQVVPSCHWSGTTPQRNWFRLHTIQPITFCVLTVLVPWRESFLFDLVADGFFEKMKSSTDIVGRYLWKRAKTLGGGGEIRRAGSP